MTIDAGQARLVRRVIVLECVWGAVVVLGITACSLGMVISCGTNVWSVRLWDAPDVEWPYTCALGRRMSGLGTLLPALVLLVVSPPAIAGTIRRAVDARSGWTRGGTALLGTAGPCFCGFALLLVVLNLSAVAQGHGISRNTAYFGRLAAVAASELASLGWLLLVSAAYHAPAAFLNLRLGATDRRGEADPVAGPPTR